MNGVQEAWWWFELLAIYDERWAPEEWVWSGEDLAANALINQDLFQPTGRLRVPWHEVREAPWNSEPPPARTSWRGDGERMPREDGPWIARYFPDDTADPAILMGKHEQVAANAVSARKGIVTERSWRKLVDAELVRDEAELEARAHQAQRFFSPYRYAAYPELHTRRRWPEFTTSPDVRQRVRESWMPSCLTDDAGTAAAWLSSSAEVYALRPGRVATLDAWLSAFAGARAACLHG